ncbi:unnamed protein product [Timema podura]|uniref:Uncharacterized protein n=1 Tax=Timema podura TaxID=61482 RepID=A0ABN7NQ30_TIMPD|nr:unnamed protein product [Timema podura]
MDPKVCWRKEAPHQLETSPERNRDDSFGKCRTFSATSSPHQYHKRFVSSTPILQLWHIFQGTVIVHTVDSDQNTLLSNKATADIINDEALANIHI